MDRINKLKSFILSWEGGFVNDPRDPGGATNKGVTLATFRSIFGKDKTVKNLKEITDSQWMTIFKTRFWDRYKADNIKDEWIAYLLVDWLWTSGPGNAINRVQKFLGLKVDGIVGNVTINKINSYNGKELFIKLWHLRENFIKTRAQYPIYGKGWLRRLNGIQYGKLLVNGK